MATLLLSSLIFLMPGRLLPAVSRLLPSLVLRSDLLMVAFAPPQAVHHNTT
jgi:hypothetical protein